MLDVEKQRKLIFNKYESRSAYLVDITLNELAGLLNSKKTPTGGILTSYVNKVKELKKGIDKYEELLERDMQLLRTKCQLLQEQVIHCWTRHLSTRSSLMPRYQYEQFVRLIAWKLKVRTDRILWQDSLN